MSNQRKILLPAAGLMLLLFAFQMYRLFAATPGKASEQPTTQPARIDLVFVHSPTCQECKKVKDALPSILNKFGGGVHSRWVSVMELDVLDQYETQYKVRIKAPPAIFVGRQYLQGSEAILGKLSRVIEEELAAGATTYNPDAVTTTHPASQATSQPTLDPAAKEKQKTDVARKHFEQLSIPMVLGAGLLDGVNPCAFTTIVFLLSTLAYLGKSPRQLAVVGIGFTFAVFVTYFVLGLGILTVLGQLQASSVGNGIPKILAYLVADLALLLALWSLMDFVGYVRSKDVKSVTLGLPKAVKSRMHKIIREGLSTRGLLIGSLLVGFLVSILESICTGQVYAPICLAIQSVPSLKVHAIAYLLLYNIMFILPLVVILIIAYKGVSSDRLGEFLRRHLAPLKLALACLFVVLGVVLLMTV